jgi:hypothetical protein
MPAITEFTTKSRFWPSARPAHAGVSALQHKLLANVYDSLEEDVKTRSSEGYLDDKSCETQTRSTSNLRAGCIEAWKRVNLPLTKLLADGASTAARITGASRAKVMARGYDSETAMLANACVDEE